MRFILFLKKIIKDLNSTDKRLPGAIKEAREEMDKYLDKLNATFNDIAYLNRIAGIVSSIESGIEYLENIVANVLKRMEETKSKCEKLGIEYENGDVHINKSLIKTLAKTKVPYPDLLITCKI